MKHLLKILYKKYVIEKKTSSGGSQNFGVKRSKKIFNNYIKAVDSELNKHFKFLEIEP